MTNTNQLIEEFDDLLYNEEIDYIDKRDRRLIENFIQNRVSQTEQECDKKWREKIENQKVDLTESGMQHMKAYNLALDDLLNNK